MENEIWKDVKGYEGLYQVSNLGRVKSLSRIVPHSYSNRLSINEITLTLTKNNNGYMYCSLCKLSVSKKHTIHRLVAISFISNNENKKCVNHIDGNKQNNHSNNLEWATPSENNKHAYDIGLKVKRKLGEAANTRKVINTINGKVYDCAISVMNDCNEFSYPHLIRMLKGLSQK